jgi:RNA polymerase sigma factor (sigma-70 family)
MVERSEPENQAGGSPAVRHDRSAAKAGGEGTSVLETTTASFAEHRDLLFSVVYNLLGTVSDTEDVLQDTWLAWASSGREEVANARAYLLRIAVNQALSRLRRERRNREAYVGPWLPEPLATGTDGAESAERAEAVSMAMLVVLETLTPLERTVFVLHEVFGYEHAEIAAVLGRSPAAVRQLAHRAREHVRARRPRYQPDPSARRAATERFLAAALGGDLHGLLEVLAPEVTLWGDGGGRLGGAARRVVQGRDKVARLLVAGAARYRTADLVIGYAEVNGGPAALLFRGAELFGVVVVDLTERGDRVRAVYGVFNPDKLTALAGSVDLTAFAEGPGGRAGT